MVLSISLQDGLFKIDSWCFYFWVKLPWFFVIVLKTLSMFQSLLVMYNFLLLINIFTYKKKKRNKELSHSFVNLGFKTTPFYLHLSLILEWKANCRWRRLEKLEKLIAARTQVGIGIGPPRTHGSTKRIKPTN